MLVLGVFREMLPSNGRVPNQRRNYFMTFKELGDLLQYLKLKWDIKWFVFVLTQFSLGLRCSECSAININDFKNNFKYLDYRQAKTNKLILNEPVPESLRVVLLNYVLRNRFRLKDGYLFCKYTGKGTTLTANSVGSMWVKWRRNCASHYKNNRWLDRYELESGQIRYRVSSHSLRRLHRVMLSSKIDNDWIVSQLCHYTKFEAYLRYKNEFEVLENRERFILPVMDPVISRLVGDSKGQTRISNYLDSA